MVYYTVLYCVGLQLITSPGPRGGAHKNFKYTPDDVERMIGELFDGRVITSSFPRPRTCSSTVL